ncbi:hypothetical protein [uncultured Pseudoalteromonas sp.]|uniref:hypothetical protein n=1 Tax=uncultured Pseudoalteromonas sp. TaxID=114053 RepID=UPI000C69FF61|nr:hypothetical protein [uncultured Pseudoalteromonas sp.]MBD57576.1 hypothetical protein [Pseudoalteromonas sp.]|tara:strand:+ start:38 stop:1021 length:984 start_codon:yes stop_codon:yes gene_type:complete
MKQIEKYLQLPLAYFETSDITNPAQLGSIREDAVITWIGRFGLSSKTVLQQLLSLTREAVNKLINRMKRKGLLHVHQTFGNTDQAFIVLTSEGIRRTEFLLQQELYLKSDVSRINERNLVHDLSIQLVVINLIRDNIIDGFTTERELALILEQRKNDDRLVDGIVRLAGSKTCVAIEMETSNSKNKGNGELRKRILDKYYQQLQLSDGLYSQVFMYSHRQRFLTQIEKTHQRIFTTTKFAFTDQQVDILKNNIKFKAHECSHIYELMFNSDRKLTDEAKAPEINVKGYLEKLDELTGLAESSSDTVLQLRLDGFKDAGVVLGISQTD